MAVWPLDIVRSRVTLRLAVVVFRSVTVHPKVPLMLKLVGNIATMGHAIPVLRVELRICSQDWGNEMEMDRL